MYLAILMKLFNHFITYLTLTSNKKNHVPLFFKGVAVSLARTHMHLFRVMAAEFHI